MSDNLAALLAEAAARHPSRPALFHDDVRTDYAELEQSSAHLAGILRAHAVGMGDRVGLLLPNQPPLSPATTRRCDSARSRSRSTRC